MTVQEFASTLLGKEIEVASAEAERQGYRLRTLSIDGKTLRGTSEINRNRVNVETMAGRITAIRSIG